MQQICRELDLNYEQLPILPLNTFSEFSLGKITDTAMRCNCLGKQFLVIGIEGRSDSLEFHTGCFLPISEIAGAIVISKDAQVRICYLKKSHALAITYPFPLIEGDDSDDDSHLMPIDEETELEEETKGLAWTTRGHSNIDFGSGLMSIAEETTAEEETEGLVWATQGSDDLQISKLKSLFEETHPRFINTHFSTISRFGFLSANGISSWKGVAL